MIKRSVKGIAALVVDADEDAEGILGHTLLSLGMETRFATTDECARELLRDAEGGLVFISAELEGDKGLKLAADLSPNQFAVVVVSGNPSSALAAIQIGVDDYMLKPFNLATLGARIERAVEVWQLRTDNLRLLGEMKAKNDVLEKLVATDPITNLYNFRYFREHLDREVSRCKRQQVQFSMIVFDVMGFTDINRQFGHAAGDSILASLGQLLLGTESDPTLLRQHDVCARLGADEIGLILLDTEKAGAAALAARIRERFATLKRPDGETVNVTAGVASFPEDGSDPAPLLAALNTACEVAKRPESNGLVSYSQEFEEESRVERQESLLMARRAHALEKAISLGSFDYAYQPIVGLETGEIFAYECLVRPSRQDFDHPGQLFDVAEKVGLVVELGRVLRSLCIKPIVDLEAPARLFINLHPYDLFDPELLGGEEFLLPWADRIVFEMTEVAEIRDFDRARANLDLLRSRGFAVAVDDLGSGYSGINNLALLGPDYVKLDMGMVRGIHSHPRLGRLVQHLVDFANAEGMKVIAEGVETAEELEAVRNLGVHMVQGYYLGRPLPPFSVVDAAMATARRGG